MMVSLFDRLKSGLSRTRESLMDRVFSAIGAKTSLDDRALEEIEEGLLLADAGVTVTERIIEVLKRKRGSFRTNLVEEVVGCIREEFAAIAESGASPRERALVPAQPRPYVIMIVGVNGAGKTTTIGKLAWALQQSGLRVLIGSGDTFRAAAHDQLREWANRAGAEIIGHDSSSADPASVTYDALQAGIARHSDVVLLDTAGRLHTKTHLMEELKKIRRVAGKSLAGAPHEVLLVLDATTGQNALQQARLFGDAVGVSGLVLTKLDGTAKGGVVLGILAEQNLPVRFIGVGEGREDLQQFDAEAFLRALVPAALDSIGVRK